MHRTVKNTSIYLSQIFVSGIILITIQPIIAHQISPEIFGEFVLAQIYIGIGVSIANLGLITGYERNFFTYEGSPNQSASLLYTTLSFVGFNLSIIFLLLYFFKSELANLIGVPLYVEFLIPVFAGSACNSLSQYYLVYLKNKTLAKSFVFFMLLQAISNFLLIVSLLFLTNLGVLSLAYAFLISNMLLILGLFFNYIGKLNFSINLTLLKPMLKISLPLTPKVFFGVLNTQFDKIMLGLIGSNALVGIYQIGQTIALMIFQFMTGLDRVFKPEVYRKLFANKHQTNPLEINNYIMPFFYLSIFVALCLGLFSKEIIGLFFPTSYLDASVIVMILSIYYASLFFGKITGTQLIYAKKTLITALLTFISIIINVGLNIPFIIYWGIIGAAIATTFTGIVMAITGYFMAQKYAKIHWQWRAICWAYSIFLLGIALTLLDYQNPALISAFIAIVVKLFIVFVYIVIGFKLNIVNKKMLDTILKK